MEFGRGIQGTRRMGETIGGAGDEDRVLVVFQDGPGPGLGRFAAGREEVVVIVGV
jgi:hypothetical protein